jgi:hypothetical protein
MESVSRRLVSALIVQAARGARVGHPETIGVLGMKPVAARIVSMAFKCDELI